MTTSKSDLNLRDHLLDALSRVPGTREFHLHVLVTSPRKASGGSLFPFAKPRPPRMYVQDILLILSEQATPDAPRVIVSAVETTVYNVPSTRCAVVYVSKVDSTGQGVKEAPSPTGTLVQGLLGYYVDPLTRPVDAEHVWVQLFARAQGQYLFPNSTEWDGKRPLSDVQLCGWWKRVLTRVKEKVEGKEGVEKVGMYFILPGFTESEAEDALRVASPTTTTTIESTTTATGWVYGHPYSQKEIPLPCPREPGEQNLGHFIPSFEDDPKTRFMEEIAYTTDGEIKSPQRKRARTMDGAPARSTSSTTDDPKPLGELSKVRVDEFWERMSFRQECVAGAVTAFFTLVVSGGKTAGTGGVGPQAGEVSWQVKKRVLSTLLTGVEFSTAERAVKATETIEGAIKGLCEGITKPGRRAATPEPAQTLAPPTTPPRRPRQLEEEISPNPFAEPVASLETYFGFIYGGVSTRNAVSTSRKEETRAVTVLAVRRKKKVHSIA